MLWRWNSGIGLFRTLQPAYSKTEPYSPCLLFSPLVYLLNFKTKCIFISLFIIGDLDFAKGSNFFGLICDNSIFCMHFIHQLTTNISFH